nr:hypothetical protein [Tanacetum cinerariifolium]
TTCHPPIFPAATCTVPQIQLLAASRRHVAASYWTAASDVAPTSAPVSAGQRCQITGQWRRTIGQRWRTTMVIGGHWWQSTTVVGGGPPLTAAGPPLITTGQRRLVGRSVLVKGRVWVGSGSGLGWVGHVACHVSATCAPVASTWMLTWILYNMWESNLVPLAQRLNGYPKSQLS